MTPLERFLTGKSPAATGTIEWRNVGLSFRVSAYLDEAGTPPARYIVSVRAIVRQGGRLVVLDNDDGSHFLPGGRIEQGETHLAALIREVDEECGLALHHPRLLGYLHFRHLTPRPEHYRYPYPDMIHLVYGVSGHGRIRSGDRDGWERAARLATPEQAAAIDGMSVGLPFLRRVFPRIRG